MAARNQTPAPGGKLEHAVLVALWERGEMAAPEIHERIGVPLDLAYTTIAKVLERLLGKGLVQRQPHGKTFVYSAVAERPSTERARVGKLLDAILGAAPRPAIATLVDAVEELDPALLDELSRLVEQRRRKP
jgi:predicted transcriptional regulator